MSSQKYQPHEDEFCLVDEIAESGSSSRGIDAFALSVLRCERQARKIFTYLVYQAAAFGRDDVSALRLTLASNTKFDFQSALAGIDLISPVGLPLLIGNDYLERLVKLGEVKKIRNKLFHGQISAVGITTDDLLRHVRSVREWTALLGAESNKQLGYDGFGRNSFRKHYDENFGHRIKQQLKNQEDYSALIRMAVRSGRDIFPKD